MGKRFDLLSPLDTAAALAGTAFAHEPGHLRAEYTTKDFVSAVAVLDAVASSAEELNHHPDVFVAYGRIRFELSSHDAGGVTERDVQLAQRIQAVADAAGATAVQPNS